MRNRIGSSADKRDVTIHPARALALCLAVLLASSCRSTGYKRSDTAALQMQHAAAAVREESRRLDAATGMLNDLVNCATGDLRPPYQRFGAALDGLASAAERARKYTSILAQKNAAYFEAWNQQLVTINDQDLRKRSEARKTEVSDQCENAGRDYQEAQDALSPVVEYLQDIHSTLSTDLTLTGLESAKPAAKTAGERATAVQTKLAKLATDLDALSARMSSLVPSGVQ